MRKGRPLLVAATGVALVSFTCAHHRPVGNLSAPVQPQADAGPADAAVDAGPTPSPPHHPVGNLRPPPRQPVGSGET